MKKHLNLGIDVHDTLDDDPAFFIQLIEDLKFLGYKVVVHLISGKKYTEEINNKLHCMHPAKLKWWDYYYSIQQHLESLNLSIGVNTHGRQIFKQDDWDKAKSKYCLLKNIDVHIENEIKYLRHFKTPFFSYPTGMKEKFNYKKQLIKLINGVMNERNN